MKRKIITIVLIIIIFAAGVIIAIDKIGEERILFPPKISLEVIDLLEGAFSENEKIELYVKKSELGVYQNTCKYSLTEAGTITNTKEGQWQSYADTISLNDYEKFKTFSDGKLTDAIKTDNGYLLIFRTNETDNEENQADIIEVNDNVEAVYHYTVVDNTVRTALVNDNYIYIISYIEKDDVITVTTIDKATDSSEEISISYSDMSGNLSNDKGMGGFIWNNATCYIDGNIIYIAGTFYGEEKGAVLAAYNMEAKKTCSYTEFYGANIIDTLWNDEENKFYAVVNPLDFLPLELWSIELSNENGSNDIDNIVQAEAYFVLPEDCTKVEGLDGHNSYIFVSDITPNTFAVIVDNMADTIEGKTRSEILALYDMQSGEMVYSCKLGMDVKYNIHDINI